MRVYARQRGLRLRMIPVPVLTPYLSSLWLGLVTPLYARIGRKLIESIVHPTVVRDDAALTAFADPPGGRRGGGAAGLRQRGTASSRRRAGPMPCPRRARCRRGAACSSARAWSIRATVARGGAARPRPSRPSRGSAATRAGTRGTGSGVCAASSTCSSAAWASGGGGPRPCDLRVGRHGGLVARRGDRARPPAAARRRDEAAGARLAGVRGRRVRASRPPSGRRRSSIRWGWQGAPTGTRSIRCISWSSAGCCGGSPALLRGR